MPTFADSTRVERAGGNSDGGTRRAQQRLAAHPCIALRGAPRTVPGVVRAESDRARDRQVSGQDPEDERSRQDLLGRSFSQLVSRILDLSLSAWRLPAAVVFSTLFLGKQSKCRTADRGTSGKIGAFRLPDTVLIVVVIVAGAEFMQIVTLVCCVEHVVVETSYSDAVLGLAPVGRAMKRPPRAVGRVTLRGA